MPSSRPALKWARKIAHLYETTMGPLAPREVCFIVEEALREQAEELREMMTCGHPVAALNRYHVGPGHDYPQTMYCRSCSLHPNEEKPRVPER